VATDLNPCRRELAAKMGATWTLDPRETTLRQAQDELGMVEGFDVGLEMSGSGAALTDMIENMCHGGKIALLGIPSKGLSIDWNTVIFNMITIKGIYGREMYETWYLMTAMIQSGLDITPIITHRFHYTDFQQGFDLMKSGNCGKIVLNWDESV
jgi:threonine 3-dehydrogenase